MIIKGGPRGGATSLANHLQKDSNERVSVVEIAGLAATDIPGALKEIMALTAGTACRDGMYHASISAAPGEAEMTPEQRARAVEILADELGLSGQPRVVVEHVKVGESGIERTHQHIVFGRINDDGKTITDFLNYPAHERAARAIEMELNHQHTPGAFDRGDGAPRPDRTPGHDEYQQAERSGLNPREAKALLSDLWRQSDSGKAFVEAAAERGFTVCQGDKCLLVVDAEGEHVRLSRRLPDRAADIVERMSDVVLPTLDEARAAQREVSATPPEIAQEGVEPVAAGISVAEVVEPSPALSAAPREAVDVALGPTPSTQDVRYDEVEAPEGSRPILADELFREEAASYESSDRSTGGDAFRDEPPTPFGGPIDFPDQAGVGMSIVADFAARAAGQVLDVAADISEGLLGLFVGAGGPTEKAPERPVQPERRAMPEKQDPPPRQTPVELFSEYARARLSGVELTEVHRQASELAIKTSPNRDIER